MEELSVKERESGEEKEEEVQEKEKEIVSEKVEERKKEDTEENLLLELLKISSPRIKEDLFKKELLKLLKEKARAYNFPEYAKAAWIRIPPHKKYLKAWREKWYPIVLAYASNKLTFKIDTSKALSEWPFSDGNVTIPEEEFKEILKEMETRGLAVRMSEGEAIILWLKPKELAEIFLKAALKVGVRVVRTSVLLDIFRDLEWRDLMYLLKMIERTGYGSIVLNGLGFKIGR